PWTRGAGPGPTPKFGAYPDDVEVFSWLRSGAPGEVGRRCLEAQVMDWSDDVAYCVHDVEDAIASSRVAPAALRSAPEQQAVTEVARRSYAADLPDDELSAALQRLLDSGWV